MLVDILPRSIVLYRILHHHLGLHDHRCRLEALTTADHDSKQETNDRTHPRGKKTTSTTFDTFFQFQLNGLEAGENNCVRRYGKLATTLKQRTYCQLYKRMTRNYLCPPKRDVDTLSYINCYDDDGEHTRVVARVFRISGWKKELTEIKQNDEE